MSVFQKLFNRGGKFSRERTREGYSPKHNLTRRQYEKYVKLRKRGIPPQKAVNKVLFGTYKFPNK